MSLVEPGDLRRDRRRQDGLRGRAEGVFLAPEAARDVARGVDRAGGNADRAGQACIPSSASPSLLAIAIGAGAAGALNMWWDADIDVLMARTRLRAVPSGLIAPGEALYFGLTLAFLSVLTLAAVANFLAAGAARLHDLLLCRHLHDVAEALDAAEHRDRRRGGRVAAGRRLRRGQRFGDPGQPVGCSRSSSSGRRRISGRWRWSRAATTSARACR